MLRLALAFSVVLLLSAGPASAEPELRRQMVDEPESLDPQKTSGLPEAIVLEDLFEGLLALVAERRTCAGRCAPVGDFGRRGLSWTFHLRPEAKMVERRCADRAGFPLQLPARGSIRRLLRPMRPPCRRSSERMRSSPAKRPRRRSASKPVDPATLKITLAQPTPWMLALVAHPALLPVPRKAIEAAGNQWTRPGNIISNGPYRNDWLGSAKARSR
ncbi:MAG: hypothetical protein WDN69_23230 [Aliidongia sp.]